MLEDTRSSKIEGSKKSFLYVFFFHRGGLGNITFVSKRYVARGGEVSEGVTDIELESNYFWRPVEETNFTVGIVVAANDKSETLARQSVPSGIKIL